MTAKQDLQTAVEDALEAMGLISIHKGDPKKEPHMNVPYAVIQMHEPDEIGRWTFGPSGYMGLRYYVDVKVVLGTENMLPYQAEEARLLYADAFREAFSNLSVSGITTVDPISANSNIDTYQDEGRPPQIAYKLRALETPAANAVAMAVPQLNLTFLERVARAASQGWRFLGSLPTGMHFREADIIYVAPYYYVFSAEGDGNTPQWGATATVTSWRANGDGTVNITLSEPHQIPQTGETVAVVKFISMTADPASGGSIGNLGNLAGLECVATGPTTLIAQFTVAASPQAISATGYGPDPGQAAPSVEPKTNPQTGMRRATELEFIASASGSDYVSRVALGNWYATVVYVAATPAWHLYGTTGVAITSRKTFSGAAPTARRAFSTTGSTSTLPMGDLSIRRNPADNYWYAVGLSDTVDPTVLSIYKSGSNTDVTVNTWTQVCANVWDGDTPLPDWSAFACPDPNIAFVDDEVYLFWSGRLTDQDPNGTGVVRLDSTTFQATGPVVRIQRGDDYNTWQNGNVLSDLVYLDCPDGVERIFGFTGNLTYDGTGNGAWACLELS